jgi:hypothetical protein
MGLDVWFKDDIRNVLLGVDLASAHLASQYSAAEVEAYRAGFQAALAAAAISFGIRPGDVIVTTVAARQRQTLPSRDLPE